MICLDDDIVLGLVEGRLAPPVLATVDEHLDACPSCRDVVTQVARSLSPDRALERGATVGRYVIGDLVGTGAMGRVYSAWEPELDRRVALKLLATAGADARDRVVREAKAMARLDHPNVVGVHEVGAAGDAVYVAMELVDGDTLRAWADVPRRWRETATMLLDVARGLAAVHAAGVTHRDVKPDNIIIGRDGRARLGDFGLARAGASVATPPPELTLATGTPATTIAGTPAYMAPEVARGDAAGAASDQFSFGVTAYEAFAGARPFTATTFGELRAAYASATVPPLRSVPGWLDAAIRRCLAIDPARRHASMTALADHLAAQLAARRSSHWIAGAALAALLASGATWFALRSPAATGPSCELGAHEVAATWNAGTRAKLAALGAPALRALDAWAAAWAAERDATCAAAAMDAAPKIAARERCLVRRRDEVAAMITRLQQLPERGPGSERVLDALAALPEPAECRLAATDPADPIPLDRAAATLVAKVEREIPAARAELALGNARPVVDATGALVETARESAHAPTLAEAQLLHAEALRATSQLVAAAGAARDAVASAERGHADRIAARAWIARVAIAGDQRDLVAAEDLAVVAAGVVDRAGAPERLVATLRKLRGLIAYNRGALDAARTLLTEALAMLPAGSVDAIAVESSLGSVERAAGNLDAAERWHQRALDADRALRGEAHPDIARDLHNLAGVARLRGDLVLAVERYSAALAIEIATRGERSLEAGLTHNSLGLVALERAQHAEARTQFTRARDILTAAGHGDRAFAEHNLGLAAAAAGEHRAALAHYAIAEDLYATTIGPGADAAKRLADDRARSTAALAPRKVAALPPAPRPVVPTTPRPVVTTTPPPAPPLPEVPPPPAPKRDVGVYGSTQAW